MRRAALAVVAITAAPLFAGRSAFAAGYYVPDTGTTARARGGAFVAAANDPLAIVYNPGGLAEQRRPQLLLDVTVLRLNQTFERDGVPADATSGTTAKGNPPPQLVPAIVYTHPLGERWTAAIGFVAPAGPRTKFDENGPQRFTNSELYLEEATYGFALAAKVHPKVLLGMYGGALYQGVTQDFALTINGTPPPSEDPSNDIPARMEVKDPFTLSAGAGVKVYATEHLELGFSYRPEANIDAGGTLVTEDPAESKEDVHFKYNVPAIWRGGIRYARKTWDVEFDVFWEGWGAHEEELLVADDGNFAGTDEVATPRKFRDAWSFRLGGSAKPLAAFTFHGGAYFETGAVPTRTMDVGTYDTNKLGLCVGASWDLSKKLGVTISATRTLMQTVEVEDSEAKQQSPFTEDVVPADARSIIGNGTYSGYYEMAGVALLARF